MKPNSRSNAIKKDPDGTISIQVKAAPVEGKANEAVVALLAEYLNIAKSTITLSKGGTSKFKTIILPDAVDIQEKIDAIP